MQSLKNSFKKVSVSHAQLAHFSTRTCKRKAHASHLELVHTHIYHKCQNHHANCSQDSTLKWCARNPNLLKFLNTCLSRSLYKQEEIENGEPLGPLSELPHHLWYVAAFLFTARRHCQIKLRSLQSIRLSTSNDFIVAPSDQERPPASQKNHLAEE